MKEKNDDQVAELLKRLKEDLFALPLGGNSTPRVQLSLLLSIFEGVGPQHLNDVVGTDEPGTTTHNQPAPHLTTKQIVASELIENIIIPPVLHPELFGSLGVSRPPNILLHGTTGKTYPLKVLEAKWPQVAFLFRTVAALHSPTLGGTERNLRAAFHEAYSLAPAVLVLRGIDTIGCRTCGNSGSDNVNVRALTTLLLCLDSLESPSSFSTPSGLGQPVFVVIATSRSHPSLLDEGLVRPGRLEKWVEI
eukprot:GHVN01053902.1.p2 GENE.GHVN01053902.1~~GHVN01053902.1.p2  ORF type:complete len:249 (-),score=24.47 GHVN01053902.1:2357-3103(-)